MILGLKPIKKDLQRPKVGFVPRSRQSRLPKNQKIYKHSPLRSKIISFILVFTQVLASPVLAEEERNTSDSSISARKGDIQVSGGGKDTRIGNSRPDGGVDCYEGCGPFFAPDGRGWGDGPDDLPDGSSPASGGLGGGQSGQGSSERAWSGTSSEEVISENQTDKSKGRTYGLSADSLWMIHKQKAAAIVQQVRNDLARQFSDTKVDLDFALKELINNLTSIRREVGIHKNTPSGGQKTKQLPLSGSLPLITEDGHEYDGYQYLNLDQNELKDLLRQPYQSSHKIELDGIRDDHHDFKPNSPQEYKAFKAGLQALVDADEAFSSNDEELGSFWIETGKILLDIGTEINPITGTIKDAYRLDVGQEPLTGERLSTGERMFAGTMIALTLYSAGGAKVVQGSIKGVAKWLRASAKEVKAAEKFVDLARKSNTVWDSIKATAPNRTGTLIPNSFIVSTENGKFWVHGNATEHLEEFVKSSKRFVNGISDQLRTQLHLTDFHGALTEATKNGIVYDKEMTFGPWEFVFGPPKGPGQLPELYHSLYKH